MKTASTDGWRSVEPRRCVYPTFDLILAISILFAAYRPLLLHHIDRVHSFAVAQEGLEAEDRGLQPLALDLAGGERVRVRALLRGRLVHGQDGRPRAQQDPQGGQERPRQDSVQDVPQVQGGHHQAAVRLKRPPVSLRRSLKQIS